MDEKRFQVLSLHEWKVIHIIEFLYLKGNCSSNAFILYERPYKQNIYDENNHQDIIDHEILNGVSQQFKIVNTTTQFIQLAGVKEDIKRQYCAGKQTVSMIIRYSPSVLLSPRDADPEKSIICYDFTFPVYLNYVANDVKPSDVFIISTLDESNQKLFASESKHIVEI